MLTNLGRIHNGEMTHLAIEQAKSAGFKRINLDMELVQCFIKVKLATNFNLLA